VCVFEFSVVEHVVGQDGNLWTGLEVDEEMKP